VSVAMREPALDQHAPVVPPSQGAVAVSARDLWFAYAANRPILRGVTMEAEAGRITMVLGTSGGGKTTLLKLIKGMLAPQRGAITLYDQPLRRVSRTGRLDRRVAYIPQQLGLVRSMSVLDNTLTGALGRTGTLTSLLRFFPRDLTGQAHEILGSLGIAHKANERVYTLSGGERQRVAIARALMQEARLILADEFVSQLDPVTTRETMTLMQAIAGRGVTLLMTTHELDLVTAYADRVVVLRGGEKVLDAPAAEATPQALAGLIKM
jgi:phosphonate transport system ATP-binding protein